jgi:hypothetical protein
VRFEGEGEGADDEVEVGERLSGRPSDIWRLQEQLAALYARAQRDGRAPLPTDLELAGAAGAAMLAAEVRTVLSFATIDAQVLYAEPSHLVCSISGD